MIKQELRPVKPTHIYELRDGDLFYANYMPEVGLYMVDSLSKTGVSLGVIDDRPPFTWDNTLWTTPDHLIMKEHFEYIGNIGPQ